MPVKLLQENPEIQKEYQKKFSLIAVDEYQDIADAQHRLLQLLIGEQTQFFAIGDPDQSIYSFRGAKMQYFLDFAKNYPLASIIRLKQNYRSTKNIIESASHLILHNKNRIPGELKALKKGKNIQIFQASNDMHEAQFIVHTIEELIGGTNMLSSQDKNNEEYSFSNFAILYRTYQQSKILQEVFSESSIPYQCIGSESFWAQEKIQNWKAFLQLFLTPQASLSFYRLLRELPGIGKKSILLWKKQGEQASLQDATWQNALPAQAKKSIEQLFRIIKKEPCFPLDSWLFSLSQEIKWPCLKMEKQEMEKICQAASEFHNLQDFLHYISLHENIEEFDPRAEKVALLTLHKAKGLEFSVVFLVGCEENLIPYTLFGWDKEKEEEERRLFYVGITRAKELLYLLHSKNRIVFGKNENNPPSRYFQEIPEQWKSFVRAKTKPVKKTKPEGEQMNFFE